MRSLIFYSFLLVGSLHFATLNTALAGKKGKPSTGIVSGAELQWSVCEDPETVVKKLTSESASFTSLKQYFLDDSNQHFYKNNHLIRVRENDQQFKTTLKINFFNENEIPKSFFENPNTECEWDYYANLQKIGCKIENEGSQSGSYLSQEQIEILDAVNSNHQLDQIKKYGPFLYEKWKFKAKDFKKVTVDSVQTKRGEKLVEISVRVGAQDRESQYKTWTQIFKQKHIEICKSPIKRTELLFLDK